MKHPSEEVERALIALNDALCTWERGTGRQSVMILREEHGYLFRSASGKPFTGDDNYTTDVLLLSTIVLHQSREAKS